ncbi:MAG: hypothetical protein ACYTGH_20570, partial [Planctomycetota bacterium]
MRTDLKNCQVTWATDEEGAITGLEGLTIGGVEQMSSDYPAPFIFQSPDGFDYRRFRHLETVEEGEAIRIRTEAIGTAQDHSWYRDQYDYDILQVGRPRTAPALKVDFILRPAAASYGGVGFTGIHMDWAFTSESANLGRLRWMQHWEVDGTCEGTTLYWQSQIAEPVATLTKEASWDNVCWKTLQRAKTDSNASMQINARAGYHQ